MQIRFITDFLKRRARRRLRRVMRGYRVLRARSQLGSIAALNSALTVNALELPANGFSVRIFGAALPRAELVVRQLLLARAGGPALAKSVLHASASDGARVVHPLPACWRRALRERGIDVDGPRSATLWFGLVLILFLRGVLTACKLVLDGFRGSARQNAPLGRYAHFDGLGPGNLPRPCRDGRSHDIVSWYMQWDGRPPLDALTHTVPGVGSSVVGQTPLLRVSSAIPAPPGFGASLRMLAWTVAATVIAAWDLLRGRWWHALLLREAARAATVRLQDPGRLATDYLFSNSGWIYRPLWTYEAERAGSRALFYFYSTNSEAFKDARGYPDIIYGYRSMSWNRYLVWDEYQADFVRRCVGADADISVVGPIWFQTGPAEVGSSRARAVAVFDVQPHRESSYRSLGIATEYYVPRIACRFLLDIQAAITECGGDMVLKRKREIGRTLHPRYRNVVEALGRASGFTAVDPAISALRVIETCAAVISMPFTSTALLGRQLGKPSVYYDPLGIARTDDRAAHGIEVLSGPDELRTWLARVLGSTEVAARLVQPANRSRG
jgi:polysaccharide biosynthesis PFTS motif protein